MSEWTPARSKDTDADGTHRHGCVSGVQIPIFVSCSVCRYERLRARHPPFAIALGRCQKSMEAVSSSLSAHRIATPASPRRRSDTCTAIRARLHRGIKAARSKKDGTSSDAQVHQDGTGDTMALSGSPCPCLQTRTREASLNQRDDPDAWSRDLSCVAGFVFGSEGAPDNSAPTLHSPGLVCLKLHRASCERFPLREKATGAEAGLLGEAVCKTENRPSLALPSPLSPPSLLICLPTSFGSPSLPPCPPLPRNATSA